MTEKIKILMNCINKVIVGKEDTVKSTICALLCGGHVLIEDVPGVGKTQLASALAKSVNGKFNRIQLTPDIMPSDVLGFSVVNSQTYKLEYHEGVAICNFLLADEINRASPKVQSSLLEIMEEHQISLDGMTHELPLPFMVIATQNPVETYGTYHLPEAQMDRFFMRLSMGYPTHDEELLILERTEMHNPIKNIEKHCLSLEDINGLKEEVKTVGVCDGVKSYIIQISEATRHDEDVVLGISPRGSISLYKASKACAFIDGRDFVTPDDVKFMAESVLPHRIILSPKGKNKFSSQEEYISNILKKISIPVIKDTKR